MNIEEFIKKHYPAIYLEYQRSLLSWNELKIGTIVVTLREGFGGPEGMCRKVIKKTDDYATLTDLEEKSGCTYSIYKDFGNKILGGELL